LSLFALWILLLLYQSLDRVFNLIVLLSATIYHINFVGQDSIRKCVAELFSALELVSIWDVRFLTTRLFICCAFFTAFGIGFRWLLLLLIIQVLNVLCSSEVLDVIKVATCLLIGFGYQLGVTYLEVMQEFQAGKDAFDAVKVNNSTVFWLATGRREALPFLYWTT